MLTALIITWLFWGLLIALEIYWRRVWVMWLAVPLVLSALWLIIGWFLPSAPLYLSAAVHLVFVILLSVGLLWDKQPNKWSRPRESDEI
jgi:hypothetical protein